MSLSLPTHLGGNGRGYPYAVQRCSATSPTPLRPQSGFLVRSQPRGFQLSHVAQVLLKLSRTLSGCGAQCEFAVVWSRQDCQQDGGGQCCREHGQELKVVCRGTLVLRQTERACGPGVGAGPGDGAGEDVRRGASLRLVSLGVQRFKVLCLPEAENCWCLTCEALGTLSPREGR